MAALVACTPGDDTSGGTRGICGEGGTLNDQCLGPIDNARDACWRLVDCGALVVHGPDQGSYDWDRCVDDIQSMGDVQQQLVIACIASSTCDQLKVQPDDRPSCVRLGDN
jgi:hypothetical protein